ncbi:MAG: hypothetical protein JWM68_2646 [Verrucomicrobiales bacterium]|nr:hypothetical protein [Verrucomicrobiales bacterium]
MTEENNSDIVQSAARADETSTCYPPTKWGCTVDDALVLVPRHITARLIKEEAGIAPDLVLIRDYGSANDVPLEDDTKIDLGEGNVFYTVLRCDVKQPDCAAEKPKFAFIVDDRPVETLNPVQSGRALRELFGFVPAVRLFRDFDSPHDQPIALDDRVVFIDGPVFYTRRSEKGLSIIVNKQTFTEADGVKPEMTGREIARLVSQDPDHTEVSQVKGKDRIKVGLNENVKIYNCEEFCVIRTNVKGGYEISRIEREISSLEENGGEVTFVGSPVPCAVYHRLSTCSGYPHISETDVLVIVPAAYPGVMLDGAYLPVGSPLLGKVEGAPQGHTVQALGRSWQLVSYHPHNGGGGPAWNKDRHGLHTYYTEILSWIQRARQ